MRRLTQEKDTAVVSVRVPVPVAAEIARVAGKGAARGELLRRAIERELSNQRVQVAPVVPE